MDGDSGFVGGRALGRRLLPSQGRVPDDRAAARLLADARHPVHQSIVRTSRGRISTILIRPVGATQIVVHLCGNNGLMQDSVPTMLADADAVASAIMGLNYPGTGGSTGDPSCADDLVQAVTEVVEAAARSFDSVLLKGESLGGAVAVLVAARLRPRVRVRVWASRTFADLPSVVCGDGIGGAAAHCALSSVACCTGWTINAAAAWAELPSTDRAVIHCRDDDVIPIAGSLYSAVGGRPDALFRCFGDGAGAPGVAHNAPLDRLINGSGQTAEEAWHAFARRPAPAWRDVAPRPAVACCCAGPWLLLAAAAAAAASVALVLA